MEDATPKSEGSPHWIPAAVREDDRQEDGDESSDDFEFAFWVSDPDDGSIAADEIFANGQIRPIYPVFNRDLLSGGEDDSKAADRAIRIPLGQLMIEEREECSRSDSTSSSSSLSLEELDGAAPDTYCVWAPRSVPPSPNRCKKSCSTGTSLRWRLRDLVVGRSHSDGKEKFVFLAAEEKQKDGSPRRSPVRGKSPAAEDDKKGKGKGGMVTAHQLFYGRSSSGGGGGGGKQLKSGRRSYLPYKPDIVGFFANVHGISRSHNPF